MTAGGVAIVLLFGIFMWGLVAIVTVIHENATRRRLAESGTPEDVLRALYTTPAPGPSAFRSGAVALATGCALVLLQVLPFGLRDPAAYGILLIAAGAALLVSQLLMPGVVRRLERNR